MEADKHHHRITPWHYYLFNVIVLMLFMGITVWASTWPLANTWMNNVIALLIAITKMMLVILVFMGVKWSTRLTKLWAATGFVWLTLMALMMGDYATREWESVPSWDPVQKEYPSAQVAPEGRDSP